MLQNSSPNVEALTDPRLQRTIKFLYLFERPAFLVARHCALQYIACCYSIYVALHSWPDELTD